MASPQARERLLEAAIEHALREGIVDLSLREIAAAIGTSHRMLIYHFGSREGLLVAVVREVERRQRDALAETTSVAGALANWKRLAHPSLHPQERLFFEIYAHALLGRPGTEGFLEEVVDCLLSQLVDAMTAAGFGGSAARAQARLGVAVTRGLLLDLLATGDVAGTTQAFELFMAMFEPHVTE